MDIRKFQVQELSTSRYGQVPKVWKLIIEDFLLDARFAISPGQGLAYCITGLLAEKAEKRRVVGVRMVLKGVLDNSRLKVGYEQVTDRGIGMDGFDEQLPADRFLGIGEIGFNITSRGAASLYKAYRNVLLGFEGSGFTLNDSPSNWVDMSPCSFAFGIGKVNECVVNINDHRDGTHLELTAKNFARYATPSDAVLYDVFDRKVTEVAAKFGLKGE